MLVTFSSKAGADILMLAQHAKPILTIIGRADDKDLLTRGVFMPEQLEAAILNLEQAIADAACWPETTVFSSFRLAHARARPASAGHVGSWFRLVDPLP